MAIVGTWEDYGKRTSNGKFGESSRYTRVFLVQSDDLEESLTAIQDAPGVSYNDSYPYDSGSKCQSFSVEPADDSGLLWSVRIGYEPPEPDKGEGGDQSPGEGWIKQPIWSAGSSVTAVPIFEHYVADSNVQKAVITNSAGDPLEGLEAEAAEFRLSLTSYAYSHSDWLSNAVLYTNAVNSDTWHGQPPGTWKCQGMSAQVGNSNGQVYWELTWEFAHRDTWNCVPWDLGFHQRVNDDGEPSGSGTKRKAIVGQDKKPVKQPVALAGGVALPPGSPPVVINNGEGVRVYRKLPFQSVFGSIYTPTIPNT